MQLFLQTIKTQKQITVELLGLLSITRNELFKNNTHYCYYTHYSVTKLVIVFQNSFGCWLPMHKKLLKNCFPIYCFQMCMNEIRKTIAGIFCTKLIVFGDFEFV